MFGRTFSVYNMPDYAQGSSVEIPFDTKNNGFAFGNSLLFICPLSREFYRSLDGLGPGIHREDTLIREKLCNFLCESTEDGIVESTRGQSKLLGLLY